MARALACAAEPPAISPNPFPVVPPRFFPFSIFYFPDFNLPASNRFGIPVCAQTNVGVHACIGAYLAHTEACIVLRALLERTRSFELINRESLPLHSSFVARSYRSLPVRLVGV